MPDDAVTGIEDENLGKLVEQAMDAYRRVVLGQPTHPGRVIGNKLPEIELYDSPLANHPALRRLYWTDPPTTEQKNLAMRSLIEWAAAGLRPGGEPAPNVPAWLTFLVLQYFYLEGRTWDAIKDELPIENTGHYQDRVVAAMTKRIRAALENAHELESLERAIMARRLAALEPDERRLLEFAAILGQLFLLRELGEVVAELKLGPAGRLVDSLLARRLLVAGDRDETYRIQPDAAGPIGRHIDDAQQQRAYRRLASQLLERRGDFLQSAHCQYDAGLFREAAALLIAEYVQLVWREQANATLELMGKFRRDDLGDKLFAELKIAAGRAALLAEKVDRAETELEAALAAGDSLLRIQAHCVMGKVAQAAGKLELAADYFQRGMAQLDALPAGESTTLRSGAILTAQQLRFDLLLGLAWLFIQEMPDHDRAVALLAEAQRALPPGDSQRECELHNGWAGFYSQQGDEPNEEKHRRLAYIVAQETGDIRAKIMAATNLGQALVHAKKGDAGRDYLRVSLELARQAQNRRDVAKTLQAIGAAYYFDGDYEEAIGYYKQALAIYQAMGHDNWVGHTFYDLAEAYGQLGNLAALRSYYEQARALAAKNPQLSKNLDDLYQRFELALRDKLDDDQMFILQRVMADGRVTNKIVQELLGVTRNEARNKLKAMVKKGLLRPMGGARKGRYYVAGGSEGGNDLTTD